LNAAGVVTAIAKTDEIRELVDAEVIPVFIELLKSPRQNTVEEVLRALG